MITALHIENLSVGRGHRVLFRGLDVAVRAGEAVALTGPNGAGKTSLLRCVAGFIRPLAGVVRCEGSGEPHLVGHQDGLKSGRTAREELIFWVRWHGGQSAGALATAERLGIGRALDLQVRQLSAGQRRRVALARLLAAPRDLWLLDEPLAPLDAEGRDLIGREMAAHLGCGGLILAAVHDPLPVAARMVEVSAP